MIKYNLEKDSYDERDYFFSNIIQEERKLPSSADLRSGYADVKNQEDLGACTAFSAISVVEYLKGKDIDLSELYFYYKERELDGKIDTDSGSTVRQSAKVSNKFGACIEELAPYIVSDFAETPSEAADEDAVNHRTRAYYRLSSIYEIMYCVGILKKPVLIGVNVYDSFEQVDSSGYIPMPDTSKEQLLGGHALNICGYFWKSKVKKLSWLQRIINFITGKFIKPYEYEGLYFIVRNSWGKDFADGGYMYASAEFLEEYSSDWWYLDN